MTTGKDKKKKVPFKDAGMIGEEETKDTGSTETSNTPDELENKAKKYEAEQNKKNNPASYGGPLGLDTKNPKFFSDSSVMDDVKVDDKQVEEDFRILSSSDSGDPKFQQALGRIKGLLGGKGSVQGIREVDWTPVDDNLKAVDKANALYKKLMELNTNMLGAPSPAIVEKLRGMIPDNLIRGVKTELPQIEQLKYDKAEAMTRVAVTSALSGMFQTLRGSSGSLPTAGAQGFTQGINAIQKREDQIANMNAAIDQKNAEIANQYFKNEQDFATAYNKTFTELEQARNTAVKTYFEEQNKLYGKMMDVIGKAYGATVKEAEGEQKSQRTDRAEREKEIGRRDRKRAELAVQMDKNNIERAKAYWQIEKASREQNYMTKKEWMDSFSLLMQEGLPPEIAAGVANTKNFVELSPEKQEMVKNQIQLQGNMLKDIYSGWFSDEETRRAVSFLGTLNGVGFRLNQEAANSIGESIKNGNKLEMNVNMFNSDVEIDANRFPKIYDLFKTGKAIQSTKADSEVSYLKSAKMIAIAKKMRDEYKSKGEEASARKMENIIREASNSMGISGLNYYKDISRDEAVTIGNQVLIGMAKANKDIFTDVYDMASE